MNAADTLPQTLQTVALLFAAGAVLALILGKFNLPRILKGEHGARYLGWLLLTPIYLLAVFGPPLVGAVILLLLMVGALIEYRRASPLAPSDQWLLIASAVITLLVIIYVPVLFGPLPIIFLFALTLLPILANDWMVMHNRVHWISWGYIYAVWSLAHSALLWQLPEGKGALITLVVGCALADIGAYIVGKPLGRHRIAPQISPNKAWEGLLGDFIGATIAVFLFRFGLPSLSFPVLVGLVVIIALGSAWGDLLSSLAKRSAGIKDWGQIIPGHGGVLDRLNSLIVVMPLAYYYLLLLNNAG
jgi:phosphatidate cytidylyltransferase